MTEIVVTQHPLNACRKRAGLTLWRLKRLLESEYHITISEGKISRWLCGVDAPIPPYIETALEEILKYKAQEQRSVNHD